MHLNATLIAYLHTCPRKLWLHAQGIRMEQTSDTVYEGKILGENTYGTRAERNTEIELALNHPETGQEYIRVKIDYYDAKTNTVHETKKSDKLEQVHLAQVKFYLYVLHRNGMEGAKGIIEYPTQRDRVTVAPLTGQDLEEVERWIMAASDVLAQERMPPVVKLKICKSCAYFDFCYSDE
jgi:CRISPR-associated exonuclease Cas4